MSFISFFGLEQMTDFKNMSRAEKKDFLSNDLIERMIRVEQRVSSHVGRPVHYKDTQYYRSLSHDQKKKFESHLRHKNKKFIVFSFFSFCFVFFAGIGFISILFRFWKYGLTSSSIFYFAILCVLLAIFILILHEKRSRHNRLLKVHHLMEHSLSKMRLRHSRS